MFVFFGTPQLAADILERLKRDNLVPSLIVTNPDRPVGRKQILTSPPVKLWAEKNNIPVLQPEKIHGSRFILPAQAGIQEYNPELFVVVAYGKILPKEVLGIPAKGALNLHYSLLPKYRGASPIESMILNDDRDTGVSIMLMDEEMDHGPIVAQRKLIADSWPVSAEQLREACNEIGGDLLAETIPLWLEGKITPREQDHSKATYTKKISKSDGEIDLSGDAYKNFLKYQAFKTWPGTFFYKEEEGKKVRVKITEAEFRDGKFVIKKIIPEGKKERSRE